MDPQVVHIPYCTVASLLSLPHLTQHLVGGVSVHAPPALLGRISHHGSCYITVAAGTHR